MSKEKYYGFCKLCGEANWQVLQENVGWVCEPSCDKLTPGTLPVGQL